MKQYRNELALAIIHAMVERGFTFFSSVAINSMEHEFHVPVDFAASDRMFFHIEGHACLVMLEIEQVDSYISLGAMVTIQAVPEHHYYARHAFAKANGMLEKLQDPDGIDDVLVPSVPGIDKMLTTLRWSGTYSSKHKSTMCSHVRPTESKITLDNVRETTLDLAEYVRSLKPIMSVVDSGMFIQIDGDSLWPSYTFPKSDQAFWSAFNSRYFRQLARRVR